MLTDREKALMKSAYEVGFTEGQFDAENGYSNLCIKESFNEWLKTPVSDCGHTVEMLLDTEIE